MKKALIVVNPHSGEDQADEFAEKLQVILRDRYDEITIKETKKEEDVGRFSEEAVQEKYDALFLMGGDGTIHDGVCAVAPHEYRPIIGVVPMGTTNNLAGMLGFSNNYEEAIDQFKNIEPATIDLGKVNEDYFITSVNMGPLFENIAETSGDEKEKEGNLAYIKRALDSLGDQETIPFTLNVDGEDLSDNYSLIIIALGNALVRVQNLFPDADLEDGKLNLLALKASSAFDKIKLIPKLLSGDNLKETPENLIHRSLQEARISVAEGHDSSVILVDGDKGGSYPLNITLLPHYLRVFRAKEDEA